MLRRRGREKAEAAGFSGTPRDALEAYWGESSNEQFDRDLLHARLRTFAPEQLRAALDGLPPVNPRSTTGNAVAQARTCVEEILTD